MHFCRFLRLHFAHLPAPLEPMERISREPGGPDIRIKRDDCTGLSTGGSVSLFAYPKIFDLPGYK